MRLKPPPRGSALFGWQRAAPWGALLLAAALPCCAALPAPSSPAAPAASAREDGPAASPAIPAVSERELLFRRVAAQVRPPDRAPDFAAALVELQSYVSLHPEGRDDPAIASLESLLLEIARLGGESAVATQKAAAESAAAQGLRQRVSELERQSGEDKAALEKLAAENKRLKATVDRLQALEVMMEEKRKRAR